MSPRIVLIASLLIVSSTIAVCGVASRPIQRGTDDPSNVSEAHLPIHHVTEGPNHARFTEEGPNATENHHPINHVTDGPNHARFTEEGPNATENHHPINHVTGGPNHAHFTEEASNTPMHRAARLTRFIGFAI